MGFDNVPSFNNVPEPVLGRLDPRKHAPARLPRLGNFQSR